MLALSHPDACYDPERHLPKEELVSLYLKKLSEKSEMLLDYFSIEISTGQKSSEVTGKVTSANESPEKDEADAEDKREESKEG